MQGFFRWGAEKAGHGLHGWDGSEREENLAAEYAEDADDAERRGEEKRREEKRRNRWGLKGPAPREKRRGRTRSLPRSEQRSRAPDRSRET
jgi:hypothetical protein